MIEVWRIGRPPREPRKPRGEDRPRGGFRRERASAEGEEKQRGFVAKARGKGPRKPRGKGYEGGDGEKRRDAQHDNRPRPARERPVDPDSPFAALQALKKELEKRE
jgi:ATP-dependent RNA helicase SUPV3L1/SUV3